MVVQPNGSPTLVYSVSFPSAGYLSTSPGQGETINGFWPVVISGPVGAWTQALANVSVVSADGTVTPIYWGQGLAMNVQDSCAGSGSTFSTGPAALDSPASTLSTTYYVTDRLGSARMELSGGGWPVSSEQYAPFGQEIGPQPTANHYKFTGLERDSESGLDHAQFRQYSSTMGRWMSPDPYDGSMDLSNPQSFNRYSYVGNTPLSLTDPSGLNPIFTISLYMYSREVEKQIRYKTFWPVDL